MKNENLLAANFCITDGLFDIDFVLTTADGVSTVGRIAIVNGIVDFVANDRSVTFELGYIDMFGLGQLYSNSSATLTVLE